MPSPQPASQYFTCRDGLRLHFRDYAPNAPGTPILCLPGLTRNSRDFDDIAARIAPSRRVITMDLRGRGLSDVDPEWRRYVPETYVDDVVELLDHLDIDEVIVLGTSLGGLIGMSMARRCPSRLVGLIMNDIGCDINRSGVERIMAYAGRTRPVEDWADAAVLMRELYGEWLPGLDDGDFEALARRGYREDDSGQLVPDVDPNVGRAVREVAAKASDPWADFKALGSRPVTLLWGELSDILTIEIVDAMRKVRPELDVVRVSRRGHVPLLDEPECEAAIDAFLERCP